MARTVLAFDIGIRNLAFCLADVSGTSFNIRAWSNFDLLSGTTAQQTTASGRCACGGPPSWVDGLGPQLLWCKRCVKSSKVVSKPALPIATTTLPALRQLAAAEGWAMEKRPKRKGDYLDFAKKIYLLPYVKPRKTASSMDLVLLFDAMESFLTPHLGQFSSASLIRLENQPVLTAPKMKSVQMILYTLLLHRLRAEQSWQGQIALVHAAKKTDSVAAAVAAAGGTYKARKDAAESLVLEKLPAGEWRDFFLASSKRSDLADALLMCLRG
jgi:hypothetical protein